MGKNERDDWSEVMLMCQKRMGVEKIPISGLTKAYGPLQGRWASSNSWGV